MTQHETSGRLSFGPAHRVFTGVSLAYLLLTFLFTCPLVLKLGSHLCGDVGDNYAFAWQLRWFSIALTELHTSPFHTSFLNDPEGASLLLNPTTLFNTGLAIVLQKAFSVLTTYNLLVLGSFWLSAVAMYLLACSLTGSPLASFVAGFVYAFSSYHFAHALGHLTTLSIEWIPLFVLYLFKSVHTHRPRHLALAAFFLVLSALCSWHFLFCCGLLLGWTVLFFSFPWREKSSARVMWDGAVIAGVTLVLLAPLLVPMMLEASKRTALAGHAPSQYPADLAAFFVPNFTSTFGVLFAPLWSRFRANPIESSTFIGISVLVFVFWAVRKLPRRTTAYWVSTLAVFLVLSLGPYLNFLGRAFPIPLPYAVIHRLVPFASVAGVPARFHVVSLLCLAVLTGFGVQRLLEDVRDRRSSRVRRTLLGCLAAGLLLLLPVEHLHVPIFMTKFKISPFYASLGRDPQNYALVDFTQRGKALFCQSVHRKRLVGGYVARAYQDRRGIPKESKIVQNIERTLSSPSGTGSAGDGLSASRILHRRNIRYLIFPKPPDLSPLRDLLLSFLSDSPTDVERINDRLGRGADPGTAVSGEILQSAQVVLKSKGPLGLITFALKVRSFFASHPELLPSNTIGRHVSESEQIVAEVWRLPVTYEDDEIRVYSADRQRGDKRGLGAE